MSVQEQMDAALSHMLQYADTRREWVDYKRRDVPDFDPDTPNAQPTVSTHRIRALIEEFDLRDVGPDADRGVQPGDLRMLLDPNDVAGFGIAPALTDRVIRQDLDGSVWDVVGLPDRGFQAFVLRRGGEDV